MLLKKYLYLNFEFKKAVLTRRHKICVQAYFLAFFCSIVIFRDLFFYLVIDFEFDYGINFSAFICFFL